MKRQTLLLSILAAVLTVALFWLLLFQPKRAELADLEVDIAAEIDQQRLLEADLVRLRQVRETAPEVESQLAAAEAIVPRDAALPSALRQLQIAADEAGVVLQSVTTSRPIQLEGATPGLSRINVNVQLLGSYFQVVDFLRRTEDPAITPRGLLWNDSSLSKQEYPQLVASLGGTVYALLPSAPPAAPAEEIDPEAEGVTSETDAGDGPDAGAEGEEEA
jgi:Tfp pilus assembly protein PilO